MTRPNDDLLRLPEGSALPYRPCVGVALFNRDGLVFIGRRKREAGPEHVDGERAWQMPQGGIDDGEEPLALALDRSYDVLVIDRMLPKRDGLSLIGELRAKDIETPALILSALGQVDDRVKGLRAGGDDYLPKPYSFSELLARDPSAREEWNANHKLRSAPRITTFGNFLRRSSLDELPQLFNVLLGDMSLVGPRPIVNDEIARYRQYYADYARARPGMTGLWQVSGRSNCDYDQRVQYDVTYVRDWSIVSDIGILLRTIKVVFGREGSC